MTDALWQALNTDAVGRTEPKKLPRHSPKQAGIAQPAVSMLSCSTNQSIFSPAQPKMPDQADSITISGQLIEVKPLKRTPLVPEQTDVFEGDQPAEEKVSAFLARVIPAAEEARGSAAGALVAWVCDVLLSEHSVKAYGRDLAHFVQHMRELGVEPLSVNADHMKVYKAALLKAGITPATIARRLSVLRGA